MTQRSTRRWYVGTLLLVAACSGGAGSPAPASSAKETVRQFLEAAADSNLDRMATLWGNAKGPAATTKQPEGWDRRIVIMQAYLRNTSHRIVAEDRGSDSDKRVVQVELTRQSCAYMVPFTTIRSNQDQWLVYDFDVKAAGTPGRPCTDKAKE